MRVLLITTMPNLVADTLWTNSELEIIDCKEYSTIANRLQRSVETHVPDIIITYRCPYILPCEIYKIPLYGAYNIHPSLLPAYKGLNPWEEILTKKETHTGVTIHRITNFVDDGEIIIQQAYDIDPTAKLSELRHQSDQMAAILIPRLFDIVKTA